MQEKDRLDIFFRLVACTIPRTSTTTHVFQCIDSRAKTSRSLQIAELKKKLDGISTDPFIANQIVRIIYQFSSNFPVTKVPITDNTPNHLRFKAERMNIRIEIGAQLLLSGFLLKDISQIQQTHINSLKLQKKPNVLSWNRSAIQILLEYSRSIWKFRSEILHNELLFTQERTLCDQAVSLLLSLRSTPYRLPMTHRNLLQRSTEYLQISQLQNVISWTHRVNKALEKQALSEKTSSTDIRTWIYSGTIYTNTPCTRL